MKILVTGSRDWTDIETIAEVLQKIANSYPEGVRLIHGDAPGADTICAEVGKALAFDVKPYPAKWLELGKSAGPIRNQQMIDEEHLQGSSIDLCLVFNDDLSTSRGTNDTVERVKKANIPFLVYASKVIPA